MLGVVLKVISNDQFRHGNPLILFAESEPKLELELELEPVMRLKGRKEDWRQDLLWNWRFAFAAASHQ